MLIHYLTSPLVAIHNRSLTLIAWVFFAVMVCSYIWFCSISSYSIAIHSDYRVLQLCELVLLGLEITMYFRSIKVFYQGKPLSEAQKYHNSFIWFVGFGWTTRYKFTLNNLPSENLVASSTSNKSHEHIRFCICCIIYTTLDF